MKSVIDQPLGDVERVHPVGLLPFVIEDNLVHRLALIGHLVVVSQMVRNIVGIEDGRLGRFPESFRPESDNVAQSSNQDREVSVEGADAADRVRAIIIQPKTRRPVLRRLLDDPREWQKGCELARHGNRTRSRSSPPVRGGEGLVEVEVQNVDSHVSGARHSDERVHIRPVHIDQPARFVNDAADLFDLLLEHPQRRGIGQHQRGDLVIDDRAEVVEIDAAVAAGFDRLDLIATDGRTGGIGPVGRIGDDDVFAGIPPRFEAFADRHQPGHLALRTRRRLKADRRHPGDLGERLFKILEQSQIPLRQFIRQVGVSRTEPFEPRDPLVQLRIVLHRTRAERIHPEVDGVVPGRDPGEMANDVDFADFRQAGKVILPPILGREKLLDRLSLDVERRQVVSNAPWPGPLKDQSFILIDVLTGFLDHDDSPGLSDLPSTPDRQRAICFAARFLLTPRVRRPTDRSHHGRGSR